MTLEELKSLTFGDVVLTMKTFGDGKYVAGDELVFLDVSYRQGEYNFLKCWDGPSTIVHFSQFDCDFIEYKVKIERDKKLEELGI